jgi:hypothetical protein
VILRIKCVDVCRRTTWKTAFWDAGTLGAVTSQNHNVPMRGVSVLGCYEGVMVLVFVCGSTFRFRFSDCVFQIELARAFVSDYADSAGKRCFRRRRFQLSVYGRCTWHLFESRDAAETQQRDAAVREAHGCVRSSLPRVQARCMESRPGLSFGVDGM